MLVQLHLVSGQYDERLTGEHVEALEQHPTHDLTDWIAYVESVRGWRERPLTLQALLTTALEEVSADER